MENKKAKILIVVKGGVVQSIYSSVQNLQFEILDFDNEGLDSNEKEEELLKSAANDMTAIY